MPKNKIPSQKDIDAQIAALREIKPRILTKNVFGDNHHDAIDAQIIVLEQKLTSRQVDDRSAFEDEDGYEDDVLSGRKWATNVRDAAQDAVDWLNGQELVASGSGSSSLVDTWKDVEI